MVARLFQRRPISQSTVENLGREVKRIAALNIDQLRALWPETMGRSAPEDLSKDVIARARAYRLKKKSPGGLDPHPRRLLMSLAKSGARRLKNSRRMAMR
jgi:hypothetical protein